MNDPFDPTALKRKREENESGPDVESRPPKTRPDLDEEGEIDWNALLNGTVECDLHFGSVTVTLVSVDFRSDHRTNGGTKLLRPDPAPVDYTFRLDAPWDQEDVRGSSFQSALGEPTHNYVKPDFIHDATNGDRSNPVSHTKNQPVQVDVVVDIAVDPDALEPELTHITGTSLSGTAGLSFDTDITPTRSPVGTNRWTIPLTSTRPLVNAMRILAGERIAWQVTLTTLLGDEVHDLGESVHKLYVTFDTPCGGVQYVNDAFDLTAGPQEVTDARLTAAIDAVVHERGNVPAFDGDNEKHVVDAVFLRMATLGADYRLGFRWQNGQDATFLDDAGSQHPTLHEYLWLCALNRGRGECHNLAVAMVLMCKMAGVQGAFDFGYMFPWPSRDDDEAAGYPKRNDAGPAIARNAIRPYTGLPQVYSPSIKGKFSTDMSSQYRRTTARAAYDGSDPHQVCIFWDATDHANRFEGAARYAGVHLYAIGDVILDTEASSDLDACVYYTRHNANASRKVSYVYSNGRFRLSFAASDTDIMDAHPYERSNGSDLFVYESVNGAAAFRWEQ
jgi:hypothetical protein